MKQLWYHDAVVSSCGFIYRVKKMGKRKGKSKRKEMKSIIEDVPRCFMEPEGSP
jgi:hypothetical protein